MLRPWMEGGDVVQRLWEEEVSRLDVEEDEMKMGN